MKYFILMCLVSACVLHAYALETPETILALKTCSNSGIYRNNDIVIEWDDVDLSDEKSYCSTTMNFCGGEKFIKFVFKERPTFLRYFLLEKSIISYQKESFYRKSNELLFRELTEDQGITILRALRVYPSADRIKISQNQLQESLGKDFFDDFLELVEFSQNPLMFIKMFNKFPLLHWRNTDKTYVFFMPKASELAICASTEKDKMDATMYFSPPDQSDFLLWKISYIKGRLLAVEYSKKENLFWVDENGDGLPDFCLRKESEAWLKIPCVKQVIKQDISQ